jgi:diguanylate cyclase (GGDEF)-like protein
VISDISEEAQTLSGLLRQLVRIGISLSSERDLSVLLERIVAEARRFTNAQAGALFLKDAGGLRFAVVQSVGGARLLDLPTLASQVARTGETLVLPAAGAEDGSRSVLAVPLCEGAGDVIGVLELVNARGADGQLVPFDGEFEGLVGSLAAQAAVAIRNARLEDLSFKDPLTGAYNRRYFTLRTHEEAKRHTRFGEPVSLVLIDVDHFKAVNDQYGHGTGDTVLREVTQVLLENSRDFSIVTRYGGDEFAVLLVNTPKPGAVRYAERLLGVIARHRYVHGQLTVSMGVATLPDDVRAADDLIPAADRAMYAAKQAGRNNVQTV